MKLKSSIILELISKTHTHTTPTHLFLNKVGPVPVTCFFHLMKHCKPFTLALIINNK